MVINYNSMEVHYTEILFAFGSGKTKNLGFNPAEWRLGAVKEGYFFSYSTK
jgi:hypothetical protein